MDFENLLETPKVTNRPKTKHTNNKTPKITKAQIYKMSKATKYPKLQNVQNYKISKITKCSKLQNVQNYKMSKVKKYPKLQFFGSFYFYIHLN